jgi:hypothetical protein
LLKGTWDTIKETMPFIFSTKVVEPPTEDIKLSRSNEDESSENDVDTTSVTDEDSDPAENTEEKKEKADNQETSSNSKEQYKEQEEQDYLSFKVYDEAAGPTYNQEIKNSLRIESQRKEILESLTTQFSKTEGRDQIVAFKRLDQVYIVSKHIVGGGVLMSKAVFAENFPNMYDTLATYNDKLGQFIGKNINNIDTKLINTLGDKYDSFKHYTSEIFAEVDKNAPQFVSDGLALFAIAGAGKVVFSTVEAGVVGATKITKKVDLQGSKKSDVLDNAHKNTDLPDSNTRSSILENEPRDKIPGIDKPFRGENFDFPADPKIVKFMNSNKMKSLTDLDGYDCSDVAEKLLKLANGKGKIIEVKPNKPGTLKLFEDAIETKPEFSYHQVYSDAKYVYDPRLSIKPVPKGDWEAMIKKLNPDGVKMK